MDDTVVLIPAYQPTENLTELAGSLYAVGFRIVVVDDGSGDEFSHIFEKTEAYATVIGYEKNRGKGYALKYGMSFISKQMSYFKYLITVDSDGQHSEDAVKRISDEVHKNGGIIIAQRVEEKSSSPLHARFFGGVLRSLYALITGRYLHDIMSGLRAFDFKYVGELQEIEGNCFDFETNVLLHASKHRYPIHTVSIEESEWQCPKKERSHYGIFRDPWLQVLAVVKTGYPSILAAFINLIATTVLTLIFGRSFAGVAGAVMLGSLFGISATVIFNNRIGFEENYDGALSYNRIIMGMLRLFAYLLMMEILCALCGLNVLLCVIITATLTSAIELNVMKLGLDKDIRILEKH